jgi:hypothetical protein
MRYPPLRMRAGPLSLLSLALLGCGGFKSATADAGSDAQALDAAAEVGSGRTGPGPHGALSSGFCCTSNAECRDRDCVDFGGGVRMCADACRAPEACQGRLSGLACVIPDGGFEGRCEPVASGTACVPASQFEYGPKKLGQCCDQTFDGRNGWQCEGNRCGQFGADPPMCTHTCDVPADCPGGYMCAPVADNYKVCAPLSTPKPCTP